MPSSITSPEQFLDYWFNVLEPSQWWTKDDALDRALRDRFLPTLEAAARCELYGWRTDAQGRLAEIIVLDQLSRNLYRNDPRAYAQDPLALGLAQEAVALGHDRQLNPVQRRFLYMPYMHSESARIHVVAEKLFGDLGLPEVQDYELRHKVIIDRFGRYPHRNQVLNRPSTTEELEFLKTPGSSF